MQIELTHFCPGLGCPSWADHCVAKQNQHQASDYLRHNINQNEHIKSNIQGVPKKKLALGNTLFMTSGGVSWIYCQAWVLVLVQVQ